MTKLENEPGETTNEDEETSPVKNTEFELIVVL